MKKVYGYIRVSTAKQGEGVSLIVQKEAIERYASQYHLEIVQWFEEKETAAKQGRPLFDAMMKLLKTKKASGVIIHKIDRSARNLKDWADLGNLIDQGVEVHFAHESLDLQARGGRLSADIQAVIAADYIRNLRQEAIKGLYGRLEQGIYPFAAPIGYLNTGKGKYKAVDPIQGAFVRKAFELYGTKNYTLHTLVEHMYHLGLRNIKEKKVNINSMSLILNNTFYIGVIKVKDRSFNGGHEPLISPNLFNQVQAILRGNTNQKINKHEFKFRKLLTCSRCQHRLIAETRKKHVYYRCHTKECATKSLREITINEHILNNLSLIQLNIKESEALEELLQDIEMGWSSKQNELTKCLRLQRGQIEQKLERLTDCYIEGGLDKATFEERKKKLLIESKTKEAFENDIISQEHNMVRRVRKFLGLSKSLINSYETATLSEQRELIEMVTSDMVVDGKDLAISMRSPFLELSKRYFLSSCAHERDAPRKVNTIVANTDMPIPSVIQEPLSEEKLKALLDIIIDSISQLPESKNETDYV